MMKTLQLTDIKLTKESDYYLSEDALIFPECKSLKKKVLVPSFLNDRDSIDKFNKELNGYYNLILPTLVDFLNDIHGEHQNIIYWERIVGFWLNSIISNYLDKYKRLALAFEENEEIKTSSVSFSSFQTPLSTKEYFRSIRESSFFHLQQYSVILKYFYNEKVDFYELNSDSIAHDASKLDRSQSSKSTTIKSFIRRKIFRIMNKGYSSRVAFYVSLFSNKELFEMFWKSKFKYAPILEDTTVQVKIKIDAALRGQISNFSTGKNLADSILHTSVKYFFPLEVLEGYHTISQEVSKCIDKSIPQSIFTGVGFYWSSQFAIWSAKCAELGTKLYGMQHGGTYGDVEILGFEFLERKITDKYVTWGWKENNNTIPMPASRLINLKNKQVNIKDQILWVTTADSRFNYFVGQIVFGNRFLNYFEHQTKFYALLPNRIKDKIKIRLYKDDFGWKLKDRFLDAFPKIKFSNNSNSFVNEAIESRLIIIDHFGGTTFLELLTLNLPVIIVADLKLFTHRKESKLHYEMLEKVGVVYSSRKEAAIQIPKIINNIDEWLSNEKRKKVVENFKTNFALTNDNATKVWLDFLKLK